MITIHNTSKTFKDFQAFNQLSLAVVLIKKMQTSYVTANELEKIYLN